MNDSQNESSTVICEICDREKHYMDTFPAPAFDIEEVCVGCVGEYLQTGDWE